MSSSFGRSSRGLKYFAYILAFLILIDVVAFFLYKVFSTKTQSKMEDPIKRTIFVLSDDEKVFFTEVFVFYPLNQKGFAIDVAGNVGAIYKSLNRVDRIDSVYFEKGPETYRDEVANILGIKSNENEMDYIQINLKDFKELTDLLGGLKLFIPSQVDIKSNDGERWLLPSGAVTLDGDKIHTYLSYKDDQGVFESVEDRRKNVFVSLLNALARNSQYMQNQERFNLYRNRINTSMTDNEFHEFMVQVSKSDFEGLKPVSINGQSRRVEGVKDILLFPEFDGRDIKKVVQLKTNILTSSSGEDVSRIYVLEIQNGNYNSSIAQGLGRNTSVYFTGAGYDVLTVKNADHEYEKTEIIDHIGQPSIAKNIGDYIGCTNIKEDEVSEDGSSENVQKNVDFTIILGADFDGRRVR